MVKQEVRELSLRVLKARKARSHYTTDKKIVNKIDRYIKDIKPSSILFYMPLEIEVDISPLIKKYRRKKLKIFVPKMEKESFKMVEYRLPLEEKKLNIFEPKSSCYSYKNVDLIIVPIIAMDRSMRRVGFGKGMYDRFYEKLSHKPKVIFVQRVAIIVKDYVCDRYDIGCDYFVSSKEKTVGLNYDKFYRWWYRFRGRCRS